MTAVMNAVTARPSGPRWLRWALVAEGRIVKEEVVPPERGLTVGADGDVPGPGPKRPLIRCASGTWLLCARDGLRGRTDRGALEELASAVEPNSEGVREIELSRDARGRLEFEDGVSLLVQLVDPPAAKREARLPASLRGGLLRGADWWFTSFVAASFFMHFAAVLFLLETDWPIEQSLIPDRYVEHIFEEPHPPPTPDDAPEMDADADEVADSREPETADEADPSDRESPPEPSQHASRNRPSTPGDANSDPSFAMNAGRRAAHLLIGALDVEGGEFANILADGALSRDAASVFEDVEGTEIAGTDTMRPGPRDTFGDHVPGSRDLGRLIASNRGGRGPVQEGSALEEVVIQVRPPRPTEVETFGPTEFDSRQLTNALRGRMGAIRACYEGTISHGDPNVAGRMTVVMDVMPVGTLSRLHIEDDSTGSDRLQQCVLRVFRSVRVRGGPEQAVEARYPLVFSRQD